MFTENSHQPNHLCVYEYSVYHGKYHVPPTYREHHWRDEHPADFEEKTGLEVVHELDVVAEAIDSVHPHDADQFKHRYQHDAETNERVHQLQDVWSCLSSHEVT